MTKTLFRKEALEANAERHLGEVLWDPLRSARAGSILALLPVLAVLGLSTFLRIPYNAEMTGYVRPDSQEILTAPRRGEVSAIYATSGMVLAPGQPVLQVRHDDGSATEVTAESARRLVRVLHAPGHKVAAGQAVAALATAEQQSRMEIYVPANVAMFVKPGQLASIVVSDSTNRSDREIDGRRIEAVLLAARPSPLSMQDSRHEQSQPPPNTVVMQASVTEPLEPGTRLKVRLSLGEWTLVDWWVAPLLQRIESPNHRAE